MECANEQKCDGLVNLSQAVPVRIGCDYFRNAYSCNTCMRLHWGDGTLVINRDGDRLFLSGENVSLKNKDGVEVGSFPVGL